ncbi:PAS domain S-box protein [Gracilimonas mengyeensis]|nr:PAS domain S-box protein [Gracilimonas mengyeensis]
MDNQDTIIKIFKASPTPTLILRADDPDFTILEVNKAALDILDQQENVLLGQPLFEAFPPNQIDIRGDGTSELLKSFRKVLQKKITDRITSLRYDLVKRDQDFDERYWEVINTPVCNDSGGVDYIINTIHDITDNKISEREANLMLNSAEDSFVLINRDLNILNFNEAYAEKCQDIFDKRPRKSTSIIEFALPDRVEKVHDILDQVFDGEVIKADLSMTNTNGQNRYFYTTYRPAFNENGNIYGALVSIYEKTDELYYKAQLEESEARYRALVETGNDVLFILQPDGSPSYVSPSLKKVLGYEVDEAMNLDVEAVVHPDDIHIIYSELEKCLQQPGMPMEVTPARMQHKDGSWHWFEGTITNMLHDPNVGGIVDNFREITDRVKAEKRIKKTKEKYQSLVQTIDGVIWEADATSFTFTYVSPQVQRILGYSPAEWQGSSEFWQNKIHPQDREEAVGFCKSQTQEGINHTFEYRMQRADGEYIWIRDVVTVIKEDGQPVHLRGLMIDITPEKELEQKLEQAYKLAKIGNWELNVEKQKLYWSTFVKEVHEVAPDYEPDLESALGFYKEGWSQEKITEAIEKTINEGSSFDLELEIVTAKGNEKWIRAVGEAEFQDGECKRVYGSTQDITEIKNVEQELKQSHSNFLERVKEQRCLYEISNIEEQELSIDQLLEKASHIIPQGFKYNELSECCIKWDNQKYQTKNFEDSRYKLAESGKRLSDKFLTVEIIYRDVDDNLTEHPFLAEEKELLQAIALQLSQKIDQIQKREKLKKTEEKYRNVVEHSSNMFYQHDTDGLLTYVSAQSMEFLGYSPDDAKLKWTEFITDHPLNKKGEALTHKAIKTGEIQPAYELQLRKADGEIIWVEVNEAPLKKNGEVVGIVGALTNITERKRYEEQLKESLERYNYVSKASMDAIYEWDIKKDHVQWGDGFEALFGHTQKEDPFPLKEWEKLVYPDDLEEVQRDLSYTLRDASMNKWSYEYRFKKADGSYAHVVEHGYIIRDEDGQPTRMIGALRDISEKKQAEIHTKLQQQVSQFFKEEKRLSPILGNLTEFLAEYEKFDTAEIWLTSTDEKVLHMISSYSVSMNGAEFLRNSREITTFKKGTGLPGMVWEAQELLVWDDIDNNQSFLRHEAADKAGLKSAAGFPLFHNGRLVGVLVLGSSRSSEAIRRKMMPYESLTDFLGAEIKRKQQEEEMLLLFESAPDILAITASDKRFVKVNPAFCDLLGYTEEELTSQNYENFVHPDDLQETQKEYSETISGERQANNYVNRWRTKNGEYRWISWSSSDVFGEDGFVFTYGRDVTEKTELEQLLNQAQKMAQIGAWEVDFEKEEVYWSPITREIHEVDEEYEPTLEEGILFYKEGESREAIQQALDQAIEKGTPWDVELQIVTALGNEKWIRVKGEAQIIDGDCVGLYGSFQDIHERKEAQLNMLEAHKERQRILERITEAFFAIDENWTVTYWNKQAEDITGISREEVLGNNLWDSFEDAKELKFFSEYERALEQQEAVHFEEYYPRLGKWFEANGYPSKEGLSVFFRDISERKQAAEELQASNKKLKTAQKIAKLGYWRVGMESGDIYWSEQAYEIWGMDPEQDEIDFETILERLYPGERELFLEQNTNAITNHDPVNMEHRLKMPDGSVKWLHILGNVVKPENSEEAILEGTVQDITEKKATEVKLQKAYEEKEIILESIGDGFFTLDQNWQVTYWNRAAEQLLKVPKQNILKENLWDIFESWIDQPSYTHFHRVMFERVNVHFEDYYEKEDKWYDINAYPSAKGISVFFKDITDRKKNEEKIRHINERFEKVTEATNDAIWDFNVVENSLFWGKGFETLFGYDLNEITPSLDFLLSRIHPDDRERIATKINQYMNDSKKSNWQEEYRFKRKDGSYAYTIDRANFIRNQQGNVIRVVGAMTDITSQKEYEAELKSLNNELEEHAKELAASNAELEQFAYVASHDLQEPLRMVTSFLTQLDKKYADKLDEKANQYIHFAVDGAQRMRQIILDLLNYSRLNNGDKQRSDVELNRLLIEVQSLERTHIDEKQAMIEVGELPKVSVNPGAIKQLFQNLINNALKYHKPDTTPKIIVSAEDAGLFWKISVKDNGIGIKEEFQDTIFQIFQRLHTRDEYSGTGIGLAISKKIVERHGGKIWVESEEGKGCNFLFTIPKKPNTNGQS